MIISDNAVDVYPSANELTIIQKTRVSKKELVEFSCTLRNTLYNPALIAIKEIKYQFSYKKFLCFH